MYQYFLYLKVSENRLVITENPINDKDYYQLMNNNGGDQQMLMNTIKMFCLGYIYGGQYGKQVINSPHEFQ